MTSRPSTAAPILAALAIVLPLGAYVVGYFWLGEYATSSDKPTIYRVYERRWQAILFTPASRLERVISGAPVECAAFEE